MPKHHLRTLTLTILLFIVSTGEAAAGLGFLVVARDRGHVGNLEVEELVTNLDPEFPVVLLRIGEDQQGVEKGYAAYIDAARAQFSQKGVDELVAIPLFASAEHYLLAKFRPQIEAAMAPASVTWAPALAESYLADEILLDRVRTASRNAAFKHIVLLLSDAADTENASRLLAEGKRLLERARGRLAEVGISGLHIAVTRAERDEAATDSQAGPEAVVAAASEDGRTLLVPFSIGMKFTPRMSFETALAHRFQEKGLVIAPSIAPHPAIRTWLRRTINAYVPASDETIGIIVMAHGATAPYNDAIAAAMPDLAREYPLAFAFGMASPVTIARAVRQLEDAGVRHAVFLRVFPRPHPFQPKSDFILGLREDPPEARGGIPDRVRAAIRFVTLGDYQADPLIAEILRDRMLEVSTDPRRESVVLLSHGMWDDDTNAAALKIDRRHAARIQRTLATPFRDVRVMALREDWPEKRDEAVRRIRDYISTQSTDGRVLVVSNRLLGSGPYGRYLEGLGYVMNGRGLLPHPAFTRWVEQSLISGIERLKASKIGDQTAWMPLSRR